MHSDKDKSLDPKQAHQADSKSEVPTHLVITQKLAESVKDWKARGGLLKLTPGNDAALKTFLGSEKLAERAVLNRDDQDIFVELYKADPANAEIYQDPQHILYAASALKDQKISVNEFSDIVFRQEMVDACEAPNVQTSNMFDANGGFSEAGEKYLTDLYNSFYCEIESITNEGAYKNNDILSNYTKKITGLWDSGLSPDEIEKRMYQWIIETKAELIKNMDIWINNFKTELKKLHQQSPTYCVFHTIKSEAYQKEVSKPSEILAIIGGPGSAGPSPGMVVKNSGGDRCIMSVGMVQCWGNVIGKGGYSLESCLGEVTIAEAEMMDRKRKHPLALSYGKTQKMLTADKLSTTPFSGTIHDYYHFLLKCRYSSEFQEMLEYVKIQLRLEFGFEDNEYSEDIWRLIDKNYSIDLLQDCVEQKDFLEMLNDANYAFSTKLFIMLDGLKHSTKWAEYKIDSKRFVEAFIKSAVEKKSKRDDLGKLIEKGELGFPEIMLDYFYQAYTNKNSLAVDIVNSNDPFSLKYLKMFLLFMEATEENIKQFEELYKNLQPQIEWLPRNKKDALMTSSGLPFFDLRIGRSRLENLCKSFVTGNSSLKSERLGEFKEELKRLTKENNISMLSNTQTPLSESSSALFKSAKPRYEKEQIQRRKDTSAAPTSWFSQFINYFKR